MTKIENYKIEFVKRTIDLLDCNFSCFKHIDREVTFLLNCLLGLIVCVSENAKKSNTNFMKKIDDDFLKFIPEKIDFIIYKDKYKNNLINQNSNELKIKNGKKYDLEKLTKLWFINKLRNGIAHQNIEGINENGKWVGIKIWNEKNNLKDFEIIFTIEELKRLSIKIAKDYINDNKIKSNENKKNK